MTPLNVKLILPREMGKLGAMEIVSGSKNPVLKSEYCNSAFLVIKAKSSKLFVLVENIWKPNH